MAFALARGNGLGLGLLRLSNPTTPRVGSTRLFSSSILLTNRTLNLRPTKFGSSLPLGVRRYSVPVPTPSPPAPPPSSVVASKEDVIEAAAADATLPLENVTPIVETEPIEATASLTDTISNVVTPALQYGDLGALGLTGWSPSGLFRWIIEIFHTTAGLSLFTSLVVSGLLIRLIVLPIVIKSARNTAALLPINAKMEELRAIATKSNPGAANSMLPLAATDPIANNRLMLQQKKMYDDAGINPATLILGPLVQVPVSIGVFLGAKNLFDGTVPQMAMNSGFSLIPDLTATSPWYLLPLACTAIIQLQIWRSSKEMNLVQRPATGHMMNGFRILTLIGMLVMTKFSSGLLVTLLITSTFTTLQTFLMQQSHIRKILRLPPIDNKLQANLPSFQESFLYGIEYFKNLQATAEAQARAQQQGKSGTAPIIVPQARSPVAGKSKPQKYKGGAAKTKK